MQKLHNSAMQRYEFFSICKVFGWEVFVLRRVAVTGTEDRGRRTW